MECLNFTNRSGASFANVIEPLVSANNSSLLQSRVHDFCQLLTLFDHDRVPVTLFSRACTDLPTWNPNGERGWRLSEDALVPEYVRALFKPGDHLSEGLQIAIEKGAISLETYGSVRYLKLTRKYREELIAQTSTSITTRLSFDVLSIVIHAFPEPFAELLWMEMEKLLREAVESTYMTILAVMGQADLLVYLSSKPYNLQSRYLGRLLHFLLRISNSSALKAPRWISFLVTDVMQLLTVSNLALDQETEYLNLLVGVNQILHLSELNLRSESDVLKLLRRLDYRGDERSNAALGLAFIALPPNSEAMQFTESFGDLVFSWKPLSKSNPSTLETIASVKLSGNVNFSMTFSMAWQGLNTEAKVIIAFEMVRNRNFQGAQAILEQSLEEVEQMYGARSPEVFIATAELLYCYNVLTVKEIKCSIYQMVSSTLSDSGHSGVLGYQFLLIQYVDHLLSLGKYLEAEELMQTALQDPSTSPSTSAMVIVRILKARRRQTKAWLDGRTPEWIRFLIQNFCGLSNSLRYETVDEILGNIYLVDMRDREQIRDAVKIITDLKHRMAEIPQSWTSHYPVLESHMQSLDRYYRAFSRRNELCKAAEESIIDSDAAQLTSAPLQMQTTPISVEASNTSWECLLHETSQKLEWVISRPLGFGKQISALGWAQMGLVDIYWVTSKCQEMALELLLGKMPASRLMERATFGRRSSILLQSITTEQVAKVEVCPMTSTAEDSVPMLARAALTLRTSQTKMLEYEKPHQLRKWQLADRAESGFMSVKFGQKATVRKELSSDDKGVFASCAFRLFYAKFTFVLRRVRRL